MGSFVVYSDGVVIRVTSLCSTVNDSEPVQPNCGVSTTIQYTIDGDERIGWMPLPLCRSPDAPYDETRDVVLFADRPTTWLAVPPGSFAIFLPHDAHAPLAGQGLVKKAVVKIAVDFER